MLSPTRVSPASVSRSSIDFGAMSSPSCMIAIFFHEDSVPESGDSVRFVQEKRVCLESFHCRKEQCVNSGALQGKLILIMRKHIINFTLSLGMIR